MTAWFDEELHGDTGQRLAIAEELYRGKTEFQDILIFRNPRFRRVMTLDGVVQTTEGDEFVYHEMMAHQPIVAHGRVKRVLIIGGGDGGLMEEVLKHPIEQVTMVELDPGVVELSKQWLPSICQGAFDDPRAKTMIGDGAKFVAETDETFDVILVDSTDPIGPGEVLFTREFYSHCKRCLTPGGVLVTQNGVPHFQAPELTSSVGHFQTLFQDAGCYLAVVPTYFGGYMALGWATDNPELRQLNTDQVRERLSGLDLNTRYWSPEVFVSAFTLPPFVAALLP